MEQIVKSGDIYLDKYSGWYSVSDEAYYDEDEIEKNDKGENTSKSSGSKVEWVEEDFYFLNYRHGKKIT